MTQRQSLKEAIRRFGETAAVRFDKGAPTSDRRSAAKRTVELNRQTCGVISREAHLEAVHTLFRSRCSVGFIACTGGFHVRGQGETWEEAFANAK